MPRIARVVITDYPHHIIQRGNNRQVIFHDSRDREIYLNFLKKYCRQCKCDVHCYCLMENHVHLLLVPKNEDSLAKAMQKISLTYTQYFNRKYKRTGRLWECRFHSAVVDKDDYLWTVCRYIERNPVRAGIVKDPYQYSWSSAGINTKGGNSFVRPFWTVYGKISDREEYVKFLSQPTKRDDIEKIRKVTYSGRPFGTPVFLARLNEIIGVAITMRKRGRPRRGLKNGMCPQ